MQVGMLLSSNKSFLYDNMGRLISESSTAESTVKKICYGLEITLKEFFDTPMFDNLEQEIR